MFIQVILVVAEGYIGLDISEGARSRILYIAQIMRVNRQQTLTRV